MTARAPDRRHPLWVYWADRVPGHRRAPYLDACLESMYRNSGCDVIEVSDRTIRDYITFVHPAFPYLTPNHQSDVFRLNVLYEYGGMYLDLDTVVLKDLRPLFDRLDRYEIVGADWKPERSPREEWESYGVGCIGPCRPHLPFLGRCIEAQNRVLDAALAQLRDGGTYPIRFEALAPEIVGATFDADPPRALVKNGSATWYAMVGGHEWWGGDLGHAFHRFSEIGSLPDSELFALSNALMPVEYQTRTREQILDEDTLLGEAFRRAFTRS